MKKTILLLLTLAAALFIPDKAQATGEPSTYFNIFVPPNNDKVGRDVSLVITAIYDSTYFTIKDDSADGDWDDTKTGMLMAGQSYVLYIRNNGVNDDAPHSGESATKQDGDYFVITSNNIVYASQSTDSDWQHDWLPSTNKSSLGQKFIVYAPKISSSKRDINVMAYEDSTTITVRKISTSALTVQGYTTVDMGLNNIVTQRMINKGQDIIHYYTNGRDLLNTGETYVIETSKPVTVQYGALFGNERDGGGYVPSSNGSSAGELFYFTVPYQATTEQEIRIVSWDDDNNVTLERYNAGSWVTLATFNPLHKLKAADWIGKTYGQTYPTVFRVKCTGGKKVSVFEANWLETGSPGTSDIATMVSSENGSCAGQKFLVYMAPPGNEQNVTNPATGLKYNGQFTHAYIFAKNKTTVTVKDAYTNGSKINRTYTIEAGRYADCNLDLTQWKSIYNGTGTTAGPERPYLLIESNDEISVMTTNFNDNWMMYFGTSLVQDFKQTSSSSSNTSKPGDTVTVTSKIIISGSPVTNTDITVIVGDGATPIKSDLVNTTTNQTLPGTIHTSDTSGTSTVTFTNEPTLSPTQEYQIVTQLELNSTYKDQTPVPNNTVVSVETLVSGNVNGTYQQSSSSEGIVNNAANTSNFQFTRVYSGDVVADSIDTWNGAWFDYDNDNDQDLYISVYNKNLGNILYRNDGSGRLTKISSGNNVVTNYYLSTVASAPGDYDNDGNIDLIAANNLGKKSNLFKNNGSSNFTKISGQDLTNDEGYAHGANWVDYDNDGKLDLFISEYLPTSFSRLYHNEGKGVFSKVLNNEISKHQNYSIGATWADYNNDGWMDLFIPNGGGPANTGNNNNTLFTNNKDGSFTKETKSPLVSDGGNSTASCWGDYDNDGDLDLFVSNASLEQNFLYRNNNGTFTRILTGDIATDKGNSHGCNWVDYDNDGWLDLFVANDLNAPKFLYHNEGNGTFTKITREPVCAASGQTFGTAWADYDKDGDMDLFMATHGKNKNMFFTNNGNGNKWINIKLIGVSSNKSAIGARVYIKATIKGVAVTQMREITSCSGFGSQDEMAAVFGLGDAAVIDSIIIKWPSGNVQKLSNQIPNRFIQVTEDTHAKMSGTVFNDKNNNGTQDAGENGIANVQIKANGVIAAYTDASGNYMLSGFVSTNRYVIEQVLPTYWSQAKPAAGGSYLVNITSTSQNIVNLNFANIPATSGKDLYATVAVTSLRRGFKNEMLLTYGNKGTLAGSKEVLTLTLDPAVSLVSASVPWDSKNGNVYTWNLTAVNEGSVSTIILTDSVNLSKPVGTPVNLLVSISAAGDLDPTNNNSQLKSEICGPIDPNDLVAYPNGKYIPADQVMTYRVRFQNVGNAPVQHVKIVNPIQTGLDLQTFKFEGASHTCRYTIENNYLNFYLENVNLPDSNENEEMSHGYVEYTIKPQTHLQEGALITNAAQIIFDYEEPVTTNTTLHYISYFMASGRSLMIYPNPVEEKATIKLSKLKETDLGLIKEITIFTESGLICLHLNDIYQEEITIEKARLGTGNYYINMVDNAGNQYFERFIVK